MYWKCLRTREPYVDGLKYCTIYEPGINIIDFSNRGPDPCYSSHIAGDSV